MGVPAAPTVWQPRTSSVKSWRPWVTSASRLLCVEPIVAESETRREDPNHGDACDPEARHHPRQVSRAVNPRAWSAQTTGAGLIVRTRTITSL